MGNAGYGNHTEDKPKDTAPEGAEGKQQDEKRQQEGGRQKDGAMPAAGPHDKPSLTNPDATPGAGTLPDPGAKNGTNSTSG